MDEAEPHAPHGPDSECVVCRNNLSFEMPEGLVEACADGKLVLFAGAGISTEGRSALRTTFYDEIAAELGGAKEKESFSDLMSRFAKKRTRRVLLQRIKSRLDYFDSFPELHRVASRFHNALSSIFYLQDIVTTNWDTYFERETGALPLVTPDDYALWEMPGRKVFKIHGSISNIGSIVATTNDYDDCYRTLSKSVLGATLKQLLATKAVVFVGYSFRDTDFTRIYRFIQRELTDALPRCYVVSLDDHRPAGISDVHQIRTDGTYFLQTLKGVLRERGEMVADDCWREMQPVLLDLQDRHAELYEKLNMRSIPATVLCGHYQDGLIHAFERMLQRSGTGEYSEIRHVAHLLHSYDVTRKKLVKEHKYHDVAYVEGYLAGLAWLLADARMRRRLPLYYVYGSGRDLRTLTAFRREAVHAERHHRGAFREAVQLAERWRPGIIPHHPPWL